MSRLSDLRNKEKPRETGITMVIDYGSSPQAISNLIEDHGKNFEFAKLTGASARMLTIVEVLQKIEAYRNVISQPQVSVYCGGTTMESFFVDSPKKGMGLFIEYIQKLGLSWVEVSNGRLEMTDVEKRKIIQRLKKENFKVISEVGKKSLKNKHLLKEGWFLESAREELGAGADFVILATGKKGRLGIFDEEGNPRDKLIKGIVEEVGLKNIIFEAQDLRHQVYLIKAFGPNVNIGNILPGYISALEALRQGWRPDTLEVPENLEPLVI